MADRVIQVDVDGNSSGIIGAMAQAENAIQTQTRVISGHFAEMGASINKVIGIIGTMSAVLAGGAVFKSFITESQQWTGETMKLAKVMGITTEEAGAYKVALHSLGLEQDVLENASMKLSRTVATKQQAFKDLGIEIKDVNTGKLLPMGTIIENTTTYLNGLEAGTNRNAAASTLFGRNWKEMQGILKLTSEKIAEGRKELKDLGLEVGPERVQQFLQYRTEVKYLGLVYESLKVQIGNALMPTLISLGQWFKDIAPAAMFVFGGALKGVMAFVEYATLGVTVLWETWKALWEQFSVTSIALVQVITKIISGDFAGAWETAKKGAADFGQAGVTWVDNVGAAAERTNERLGKLFGLTPKTASKPDQQATGQFDPDKADKDAHGRQMSQEDAKLKAILAGFKMREQAVKEGSQSLIQDESFYFQTGLVGQDEFNAKKYELERQSLIKTQGLIGEEIKAIKEATARKLAIAQTPEEKGKVSADGKKETTDKVAEKQKLNAELYQLDAKYFTETTVLAQKRASDMRNYEAQWFQTRRLAEEADLQKTKEFYGMVQAASGLSTISELARIDQEEKAWIRSWAMQTSSFEEFEKRKAEIEKLYAKKRADVADVETKTKISWAASGFQVMGDLADSFYQLSNKKNKVAFEISKQMRVGETVMNTASAAMAAYNAMVGIPYIGPALAVAAAAAAIAAGLVQIKNIESASPNGGGSMSTVGGDSSTGSSPSSQVVQQPVGGQNRGQGNVTVQVMGNIIGEQEWVDKHLIPAMSDAVGRGLTLNVGMAR